jgi:Uma2 family endonuclease
VLESEVGYHCFAWKPGRVRRADVSFIRRDRYSVKRLSKERLITIPPDLAVEVISPNDLASELDEKLEEYLRAGVRLIWVINPQTRTLQIFRADGSGSRLHETDELLGEDVVPGFCCPVRALFPEPFTDELQSPEAPEPAPRFPPEETA